MECSSFIGALLSRSGLGEDAGDRLTRRVSEALFRDPYYTITPLFHKGFRTFSHSKHGRFSTCSDRRFRVVEDAFSMLVRHAILASSIASK